MVIRLILLLAVLIKGAGALAHGPFLNIENYLQMVNYSSCEEFYPNREISIAIIEKSFPDLEPYIGDSLPSNIELILPEQNSPSEDLHGLYVAQLYYQFISNNYRCPENTPKIYLIPAAVYSHFIRAVDKAIELDVDIILHTAVFPHHGNGDGLGFLNNVVNKATDRGIHWINATGNMKNRVFLSKINPQADRWLKFDNSSDRVYFRCAEKECNVKIYLQWDAFKENDTLGTDKDLDITLYDDSGRDITSSNFRQTSDAELMNDPRHRRYPFEIIEQNLKRGTYFIRIKDQSSNFDRLDELRVLFDGDFVEILNPTRYRDFLFPPADNMSVIAVGGSDDPFTSISGLTKSKPDVCVLSSLETYEGNLRGSSTAATTFSALYSMILQLENLSEDNIFQRIQNRFFQPSSIYLPNLAHNYCHD